MRSRQQGFTLVEVSIVLVVIGLLVGGVLVGKDLVRASQLNALGIEKNKLESAIGTFKEKYLALPGDIPNAFSFWTASCGTDTTTIATGCNGDGNGSIDRLDLGENVKAWEHLVRSELIVGGYDGSGTVLTILGHNVVALSATNSFKSRFPSAYWDISADGQDADFTAVEGVPPNGLWLVMGSLPSTSNQFLIEHPNLTAREAFLLDTKLDDGKAATGAMRGDTKADCDDLPGTTDYYHLAAIGPEHGGCMLYFQIQ